MVKGTQSQGVIATLKHISLNVTETNKFTLDAVIEEAAHREADLLAFEIAHEQGQPGAQRLCRHHSDAPRGRARA
jgi:beta-glucosidase